MRGVEISWSDRKGKNCCLGVGEEIAENTIYTIQCIFIHKVNHQAVTYQQNTIRQIAFTARLVLLRRAATCV